MWKDFNNNPTGRKVGDCAVRAVSVALNIDWETAYAMIANNGFQMGDMPSSNSVWGAVLRQNGFQRYNLSTDCPNCYSIKEFCNEHTNGTYVIGTGTHVVTAINGDYYDTWNSGDEVVAFVWCRKE